MAKTKKKGNAKKKRASKLFVPLVLAIVAAVSALVVIINPFNIVKIIKNNYPNLVK